jgi:hypothetical protein
VYKNQLRMSKIHIIPLSKDGGERHRRVVKDTMTDFGWKYRGTYYSMFDEIIEMYFEELENENNEGE